MVNKFNRKYLYQKRDVFYFSKQVPRDLKHHYAKDRIVVSLKTKSIKEASHLSQNMLLKLNRVALQIAAKYTLNTITEVQEG